MTEEKTRKKILVAPLNWGLGHASRCIPIIRALLEQNFEPVLASDGEALELLRQEFPDLKSHELPSYGISYSKRAEWMPLKMLSQMPRVTQAAIREHRIARQLVRSEGLDGLISDNRFGLYSNAIPSVYLTHQLNVLSGKTTPLTSGFHRSVIRRFDACWVCDYDGEKSLSGRLSHCEGDLQVRKIGPLSRFGQQDKPAKEIDICFILSGPEPQRSALQELVEQSFSDQPGKIVLVEGKMAAKRLVRKAGNIMIYNYLLSTGLEALIASSSLVVSRSGFSSIMDLNALGAKAFFIPTPGQTEQEYLAKYLKMRRIAGFENQSDFGLESLREALDFKGFEKTKKPNENQFLGLFDLFKK